MKLIEFAEKIYQVPLTEFQKSFLTQYEKSKNDGKTVFITFPMHSGKRMMENIIKKWEKKKKMTESEFIKQNTRIEKYKNEYGKIGVIEGKRTAISNGIFSISCKYSRTIDFDFLGDDFKERLQNAIVSFLDSEIEAIKKSMEDI